MRDGSVLVDISVDQGGCFESTRPTTHSDPTFEVNGSLFYCVANMPGAVPHSSTHALVNATLPYVLEIANHGWRDAVRSDPALAEGVNVVDGSVVYEPVAAAHGMDAVPLADVPRLIGAACRRDRLIGGPTWRQGVEPGAMRPPGRWSGTPTPARSVGIGHRVEPDRRSGTSPAHTSSSPSGPSPSPGGPSLTLTEASSRASRSTVVDASSLAEGRRA